MYRQFDSPAGRRFLTLIREGGGLKPSARAVGVNKETGYRWLRDEYFRLRGEGLSHAAAQAGLGFFSDRAGGWNERFLEGGDGRHHFQVAPAVEDAFWSAYLGGASLEAATVAAGVNRKTGYRWLYARFVSLRSMLPEARVREDLRLLPATSAGWETRRKKHLAAENGQLREVHLEGIREARRFAEHVAKPPSAAQERRALRETRYWELVNAGASNARACRMLGMSRHRDAASEPAGGGAAGADRAVLRAVSVPAGTATDRGSAAGGLLPTSYRAGTGPGRVDNQAGAGPPPGRAGPIPAPHRRS